MLNLRMLGNGLSYNNRNCKLKSFVYLEMLSLQRNQMRKPIQLPYQVTSLQGEGPQCSGWQMLLRAALTVCCFNCPAAY